MNINQAYKNLPQNLYHITTTEKLAKIKQDKLIKAMPDTLTDGAIKGVFTFDLDNFIKQWAKDKHMNLARLILDYIARGKELVMLRIPVNKLPVESSENIRTRDVNKAIDWKFSYGSQRGKSNQEILGQKITEVNPEEINKIAIEHIIPTDIGIDKIECLGTSNYDSKRSLADILMGFFKGHNEENIIKNNMDLLI